MALEETDPVAIAINQLSRDPGPGEVLCRYHLIQRAVDPKTGQYTKPIPMLSNYGPIVDKSGQVVDAPMMMAPSALGVCEECWREQRSDSFTTCPLHGVQPRTGQRCAVCDAQGVIDPRLLLDAGGEGATADEDDGGGVLATERDHDQPESPAAALSPLVDASTGGPNGESAWDRGRPTRFWFGQ